MANMIIGETGLIVIGAVVVVVILFFLSKKIRKKKKKEFKEISLRIHEMRGQIREYDKLLEDLERYFVKVEGKLKNVQ